MKRPFITDPDLKCHDIHLWCQTILASDNLVTSLPPDLHTAPRLALLQLASNPLDKEEAALLAIGLDQVRAVMAARGTKPLQVGLRCMHIVKSLINF